MARIVLLLVALLLAGCAEPAGDGSPADDVVGEWEGEWELVSGTASGQPLPQPADARATLVLDDAEATGTSFCNHFSTGYSVDGSSIRFDGLGGTDMGCEPAVMDAEATYLSALGAAGTVALDGEDLLLTGADVELRFRPVPPVPLSRLTSTDWVLETLVDGEVVSSVVGRSVLRLEDDGTFTGTTAACHTLSGRWQPTGDEVVVPDFAVEGTECPTEFRGQDEHVLAVLGDGFQVSIEEDRLTALDADGRGLVYRDQGSG